MTVVGGANIDLQGFPDSKLRLADSNPGSVRVSAGGVGRNIAENAARLGLSVRLLSVFGDDAYAAYLLDGLRRVGVDTSASILLSGSATSTYLCILERDGSLHVAIADMRIEEELSPASLEERETLLQSSDLCVFDANLSEPALERGVALCGSVPAILDTVSVAKAKRARAVVGRFFAVKPNEGELEVLSDVEIRRDGDLDRAADALLRAGTREVFVSLGPRGLYFCDGSSRGVVEGPTATPHSVSGAGDALTAALAVGTISRRPIEETAAFAAAAAALAAESPDTVSADMSADRVQRLAAAAKIRHR